MIALTATAAFSFIASQCPVVKTAETVKINSVFALPAISVLPDVAMEFA